MTRVSALVAVGIACLIGGCASGPSAQDIQQLELQVNTLQQRINALEQARHPGAPSAGTTSSEEMTFSETATSSSTQPSVFSFGQTSASGAAGKLFRGGVNVVTGWVEIPKRIQETNARSGLAAGLTWGLLRGLGYGFIRTAGGFYELVTFPVAAPANYEPVMQPAFVF